MWILKKFSFTKAINCGDIPAKNKDDREGGRELRRAKKDDIIYEQPLIEQALIMSIGDEYNPIYVI